MAIFKYVWANCSHKGAPIDHVLWICTQTGCNNYGEKLQLLERSSVLNKYL